MLESFWYIACDSRELRNAPISRVIFGKPLAIFRDSAGVARVLEDRCAHRNFPLSAGCVVGDSLQCAYHGWRYDPTGRVCEIPSLAEPVSTSCQSLSIGSFPCVEQDGYVWTVPSGNFRTDKPPEFPRLGQAGYHSFRMKTRFDGDVETCLENFLDCPHAAFVHAGLFRTHSARMAEAVVRVLDDGAEVEYFNEAREKGVVWKLLSNRQARLKHRDRFIRPAASMVDYVFSDGREYVITSHCTPVGDKITDVYTVISFRFPILGVLIKPIFHLLSRRIIQQDVLAVRRQRDNIERFGGKSSFRLVETDFLLPHILRWRNSLRDGKATPSIRDTEERRVAVCI